MAPEILIQLIKHRPFQIRLRDGRTFLIRSPDSVFVGTSTVRIEQENSATSDTVERVNSRSEFLSIPLGQILDVEPLDQAAPRLAVTGAALQHRIRDLLPTKRLLTLISAYMLISIVSLPFAASVWVGELPILALIQLPIVQPANWFRINVVMPLMIAFGTTTGSFSPDNHAARPYGLIFPFSILAIAIFALVLRSKTFDRRDQIWTIITFCVMALDALIINWFSDARLNHLSIY